MDQANHQLRQRESEADIVLSFDAFVRSVGIRRTSPLSVFIGAGASISSGLPSAELCIWEWKRNIFLTNNPGLEDQFTELSLPGVRRKVQTWLDGQGSFPPERSPDEYGFYIEKCFPIESDRRAYFQSKVRDARPHIGYQLLCHLAEADLIRSVWSTNFDGLAARAAASFSLAPIEIGIDSQQRIARPPGQGELLCVSLHGDYRYDALKNTPLELQTQEEVLRAALSDEARNTSLIVVGYSGRDQSIMDALQAAYSIEGNGVLYWCGFGDGEPPDHIAVLLRSAREHGRQAYYVPTSGFDDTMTRLVLHCLQGEQRQAARRRISALTSENILDREPFKVPQFAKSTFIKSNAFEIECPAEVFQFDLKSWPSERVWAWLREKARDRPIIAVPFRTKVLALGTIDEIREAFSDTMNGPIERAPVLPRDLRYEDGTVISLMRQALVRSMAGKTGLKTDGKKTLWKSQFSRTIRKEGITYRIHEAARISLRLIGEAQYVVLLPTLKVYDQAGVEPPKEIANPIKLKILGYQHNKPFNAAVNDWRKILFPDQSTVFEFPLDSASTFKFRVRRTPIYASIGVTLDRGTTNTPDKLKPHIKHRGLQLAEPPLLFSNKAGTSLVKNTHPIQGILENRPYDYPLTVRGLSSSLRIGVVCPAAETKILQTYLQSIHQTLKPTQSERDYLLDYPGFQTAFGVSVEPPDPGSPGWIVCPEPSTREAMQGALETAQLINRSLESLYASYAPDVTLIFFPDRWRIFRTYSTESESFDLHNFVKAYSVQRGIATQFLEQGTLSNAYQCRVWWWLSLALYVKGMRTPWLLDNLAEDTAFVGLGFSIDPNARKGRHVVLGCSHIYNARGEGLQYRLSKIENPIIRGGNPFMSADDARTVGESIRQLFFDARMKLPNRVVLHKSTPFMQEEREGLRDGLSDVAHIDMLEIQVDHALRYISSIQNPDGTVGEDNYPVQRGTAMKLDDYTALLWVHGATKSLKPQGTYFQGKRRIPAPLVIRHYAGRTPLQELAGEILGLSKMNWNTFDLYTKLPATLQSSGEIAKIGSLLQRFGSASYDYRLFI